MKYCKTLLLTCVMALLLSMTAFAQTSPTETVEVPEDLEAEVLSAFLSLMADGAFDDMMPEQPEPIPEPGITPDGNLTMVDDIVQANKQFITLQSKNGNYFYLVIDRSGDTDNVYFLNLVDESDLLALIEKEPVDSTQCICTDPCIGGTINHNCPVCDVDTAACRADVVVEKEPEPEPEPLPPVAEEVPVPVETEKSSPWPTVIVVLLILGAGTVCYFKFLRKKPEETSNFTYNDDDYESGANQDETEEDEDSVDDFIDPNSSLVP